MSKPKIIILNYKAEDLAGAEVRLVPLETTVLAEDPAAGIDFERTPYTAIRQGVSSTGRSLLIITEHTVNTIETNAG